jgi:hypothetical protein
MFYEALMIVATATCDPAGTRTQGPYIKSVLLYQLSYRIINLRTLFPFRAANI